MAVGDVNSDKPGSGARYNDGKLQMDLVPVIYWLDVWLANGKLSADGKLCEALEALAAFQMGDDQAIGSYMHNLGFHDLSAACRVLEYGANKYAAWNWAKGMDWSVPTGCALRHAAAMIEEEEGTDEESGELHMAHVVCNMMMLDWFLEHYPEGDDRPPVRQLEDNPWQI